MSDMNSMASDVNYMLNFLQKATEIESKKNALVSLAGTIAERTELLKRTQYYCDSEEAQWKEYELFNNNSRKYVKKNKEKVQLDSRLRILILLLCIPLTSFVGVSTAIWLVMGDFSIWRLIFSPITLLIAVVAVILLIRKRSQRKELVTQYTAEQTQHLNNMESSKNKKVQNNNLIVYLDRQFDEVDKRIDALEVIRTRHYAQVPTFHSKYKNLEAVATMQEWLIYGKCDKIIGHGGIYDTYDNFIRDGIIVRNLQELQGLIRENNRRLAQIEENQRILISETRRSNEIASKTFNEVCSLRTSVDSMRYDQAQMYRRLDSWLV